MKRIMLLTTMVLAVTFGTAYAFQGSGEWTAVESICLSTNGITIFCPASFDTVPFGTGTMSPSFYEKSSAAGGFRGETVTEPYNGITYFSLSSTDFEMVPVGAGPMSHSYYEESSAAGGLRSSEPMKANFNGVTDFTGASYDSPNIGH